MVFAGSSALHQLIHMWHQPDKVTNISTSTKDKMNNWRPGDVDTFFLNMPQQFRQKLSFTDLVHVKAKTPEELLMNFDLPCCRVAVNTRYDIWVSAHALYAVMTGKYYLPLYLKTKEGFSALLAQHKANPVLHEAEDFLYDRFTGRVDKYKTRGFTPEWVATKDVTPWIKDRFIYAEWKVTHKDEPATEVEEAIAKLTAVLQAPEAKKAVLDFLAKITSALSLNEKKEEPAKVIPPLMPQSFPPMPQCLPSVLPQMAQCTPELGKHLASLKPKEDYVSPLSINSSQLPVATNSDSLIVRGSAGAPGAFGSAGAPGAIWVPPSLRFN